MIGEVAEEVEPPDRDDQPRTRVERTGETLPDGIGPPRRVGRRIAFGRERPAHQPRGKARMDLEPRGQDRKQHVEKRTAHVRPSAGISAVRICIRAVVVIILHTPLPALPAPGRGDTSGPPGELQRHGEIVLGILVDEDVQPRSKTDIVKIITGIVDRKGLQFGSPPVAHVKLRSVAHAQFVVEGLRDGWHFVLAGIDEGLRRSGPGRDGKQQEKKFLHCMTVRFSCKHNYFSRHNKISTADCAL